MCVDWARSEEYFSDYRRSSYRSPYIWEQGCWDGALKSMTWCNRFGIHYLFNDILVSDENIDNHGYIGTLIYGYIRYIGDKSTDILGKISVS